MAVTTGQALTAFSFMQEGSKDASGQKIYNVESLGMFVKTAEVYERELKRVFGEIITTKNEIDKVTGQMSRTLYIPKERTAEAQGVIEGLKATRSTFAKDSTYMYVNQQNAHMLEVTREIKGAKAQAYAKEELVDIGGVVKRTPNTANKDMMTSFIPVLDDDLNNMSAKDRANFLRSLTPKANSASIAEQRDRTIKEQERIHEQEIKEQERIHEQEITDKARIKKLTDRENARKTREQERQWASERKAEEAEAKEEQKERLHSRKVMLGRIGVITTALSSLVDISRRILVSVLDFSSKVSKDTTQGRTLEIGYSDVRALNYLDQALGLKEGTNIQAQEDFRAKFGNTAKLDTEALKWLAMVMGEDVGAMVQSGLGGENPAQLVEATIDAFFKRWQSGQDQYGNTVGQDKARRELVTLLESVSPSVARIFERMVEEYTHGLYAGQFDTYKGMQSHYIPVSGGLTSMDWEQITLVGKEADDLRTKFKNLGELISGELTLKLSGLIAWLNSKPWGGSPQEKYEKKEDIKNQLKSTVKSLEDRSAKNREKLKNLTGYSSLEEIAENAPELAENPFVMDLLIAGEGVDRALAEARKQSTSKNPVYDPAVYSQQGIISAGAEAVIDKLPSSVTGAREFVLEQSSFSESYGNWVNEGYSDWNSMLMEKRIPSKSVLTRGQAMAFERGMVGALSEILGYTDYQKKHKHTGKIWKQFIKVLEGREITPEEVQNKLNAGELEFLYPIIGDIYLGKAGGLALQQMIQEKMGMSSDKYELNTQETKGIYEQRASLIDEAMSSSYADQIKTYQITVQQGSTANTLDINLKFFDSKGKLLDTKKATSTGEMTGTLEEMVDLEDITG